MSNQEVLEELLKRKNWFLEVDNDELGNTVWKVTTKYGRLIKKSTIKKETGLSEEDIQKLINNLN